MRGWIIIALLVVSLIPSSFAQTSMECINDCYNTCAQGCSLIPVANCVQMCQQGCGPYCGAPVGITPGEQCRPAPDGHPTRLVAGSCRDIYEAEDRCARAGNCNACQGLSGCIWSGGCVPCRSGSCSYGCGGYVAPGRYAQPAQGQQRAAPDQQRYAPAQQRVTPARVQQRRTGGYTSGGSLDFDVSARPIGSTTVLPGKSVDYDVTVNNRGDARTIRLTASKLPKGTRATLKQTDKKLRAVITISTSPSTPPGMYSPEIVATSGTLTRKATLQLRVK